MALVDDSLVSIPAISLRTASELVSRRRSTGRGDSKRRRLSQSHAAAFLSGAAALQSGKAVGSE